MPRNARVRRSPLAVVDSPLAVVDSPLAVVDSPLAVVDSPLAVVDSVIQAHGALKASGSTSILLGRGRPERRTPTRLEI